MLKSCENKEFCGIVVIRDCGVTIRGLAVTEDRGPA